MKRLLLLSLFTFVLYTVYGQVETRYYPKGNAFEQEKHISEHPKANKIKEFSSFDVEELKEEDKQNKGLDIPFRFGKGFDTKITLADGVWTTVKGGRLWSMGFRSKGAYSINFVFERFYLPDSANLYSVNSDGSMLYGPVTSKENTKDGYFLTDLVQGDEVYLYLFEPDSKKGKSELTIKRVVHAYKDVMSYGNLGGSESCNNDIACFPDLDEEADAVALVLLSNGTEWCSGSLLMTANQSFVPYFLSAFHCIDVGNPAVSQDADEADGILETYEIANAENWMFKFQYKMTSCGGSTATTGVTYNGAEFRAAWGSTDFALLEMDGSPVGDTRFSWLGWDRSGNTPTSGTGIHHPSGDVMKISFDNNQFQTSNWGGTNNHWLLSFDDGIVEHGSSGSPVFDQNERLVGQLHGNQNYNQNLSYCSQPRAEYGKFNVSWFGDGSDTTRLINWLDPCGSGAVTTNTSRSPYISGPTNLCSSGGEYNVHNAPSGSYVRWNYSSNITSYYGGNTWIALRATGNGVGWVEAYIPVGCDTIFLPRMSVWAGIPTAYNFYTEVNGQEVEYYDVALICPYITSCLDAWSEVEEMGTTNYTWHLPSWYSPSGSFGSNGICFNPNGTIGSTITADVTNSCGTGYGVIQIYLGNNGCKGMYQYVISPNPVITELSIEQLTNEEATGREVLQPVEIFDESGVKDSYDNSYTVEIWHEKKGKVISVDSKSKKEVIDFSGLDKGRYFLHIRTKYALYKEHILVK